MAGLSDVKAAVKDVLVADYPAVVAAVAAAFGPSAPPVGPFAEVHTAEKATLGAYPVAEILGDASTPEGGDDGQQTAEVYRHALAILVSVLGDDEETVTLALELQTLALRRVLRHRLLAAVPSAASVVLGREDYAPTGRRGPEGPFLKSSVLECVVTTYD